MIDLDVMFTIGHTHYYLREKLSEVGCYARIQNTAAIIDYPDNFALRSGITAFWTRLPPRVNDYS
jgi:hypothetical protein